MFRTVLPKHFDRICKVNGIASAVVVEASGRVEDNQWMLDLVKHNLDRYAAMVGSLPVGDDSFAGLLERFSKDERYVGIRLRVRTEGEHFFTDAVWRDLALLSKKGLVLDVLLENFSLEDVASIAQRNPDIKILINHLTGLNITGKSADPEWTKSVQRVAAFDNVYCKVSGIFQRSGKMTAPKDLTYYEPTIEVVYAAFGEDRIIYGSNWPVSDRGGSYGEQLAIIRSYFESKGERVLQNIFVTNAQKFYGLD